MIEVHYLNLEPNHEVRQEDDLQCIYCPFEVIDDELILHERPTTLTATFSTNAESDELECPRCEVLNGQLHYLGSPDCEGTGDEDEL